MWALVLSTLGGAVLSAFLYPLVIYLNRVIRSRDSLRRLFQLTERLYLVPSYVSGDGRTSVRDADYRVASAISRFATTEDSDDTLPFSFSHPAFPLVILGSTRYNRLAAALQTTFHLPYQFVESRHSADPSQRRLSVVTEFGEELVSSRDNHPMAASVEVDYGILLIATLRNGKRLFWIAGIHSVGTEGIWQYIKGNSDKILGWLPAKQNEFTAVLIRVRFEIVSEKEKKRTMIQGVEALGPPRRDLLHARTDSPPKALLCDLGNVLMDFDRTRTYRAIAHYASRPWGDVRDRLEDKSNGLRESYERGALDTEAFCDGIYSVLKIDEQTLPRALLKEFWSDIFWLNKELVDALSYLHKNGICLVLFSNTNPLHFEGIQRDYPDVLGFFAARVLSYEVGCAKPGPAIFERAIAAVRSREPACPTAQMLVVDDTAENVEAARGFGMKALMYQSYSHFIWWARTEGMYIP